MKLVNKQTGAEIHPGDKVQTLRGELVTLIRFTPPHKMSTSSGRVLLENGNGQQEFFPGVIDAKIVE